MPRVSDEYLADRQDQVLDAAIRSFASGGFHATGMAEVIRESGLSAGSVYRYYKSKDALIDAIIERLMALLSQRLGQATQGATTVGEVIRQVISAATADQNTTLARLLPQVWTEAMRNPEIAAKVAQGYQQIIGHFEAFITELQQQGKFSSALPASGVAQVILSVLQGYQLQMLLLGKYLDTAAYLEATQHLFPENTE